MGEGFGDFFIRPGYALGVDVMLKNEAGVSLYIESLKSISESFYGTETREIEEHDNDFGVYLGAKVGSIPGLLVNIVGGIIVTLQILGILLGGMGD